MRSLIAILVALACVEGSAGMVSRQAASPPAPAGFVVYCFDPSAGKNWDSEPVAMLRTVPSGKAVPLFKDTAPLPFSATAVLSVDPTGRYVAIRGIPKVGPVAAPADEFPVHPFWLWALDLKTGTIIPLPGRTLLPTTDEHPGYNWSAWCPDEPVIAVNINDFRGDRLDLWDMRTGRIRTVGTNWIKPKPGQLWPDQDHIWICGNGTFLDAFWDVRPTNRLTIRALGSKAWKASWPLKPRWNDALHDVVATPDATRFAATTGSSVVMAERGKRLRKLPLPDIHDLLWSHDGRVLAGMSSFVYDRARLEIGYEIGLINPESGHFTPLTGWGSSFGDHDNDEHMLTWSDDDRSLVGWTGLTGYPSYPKLWSLDISTKKKTVLWDSKDVVTSFAWHEGAPPSP